MSAYGSQFSAERMAKEFNAYICENKANARHVRKVGPWLGPLVAGIEKVKVDWWIPRSRQLHFETAEGRRYKAKYTHADSGVIDIIEIAKDRGEEEIGLVFRARSLPDALRFYLLPQLSPARTSAAA
jgi:hypothetical protein